MKDSATARLDERVPASAVPAITGVKLSPGDVVDLINISRSGMLIEGKTRFVPGTRVTITLDGSFTPPQVRAKIIRCQVSAIVGGALRYQCGLQFDQALDGIPANETAMVADGTAAATLVGAPVAIAPPPPDDPPRVLVNRW
jgi:hypothetical protein